MESIKEEKSLDLGKLVIFFIIFTIVGIIGSYIYLGLIDWINYIRANFLTAFGYAGLLAGTTYFTKKCLKITNQVGTVIAVILGIIFINYFKWQLFFGIWIARYSEGLIDNVFVDFRLVMESLVRTIQYPFHNGLNPIKVFIDDLIIFNELGTWAADNGNVVSGVTLGIVWVGEFITIFSWPIIKAGSPVGILINDTITDTQKWADANYLVYNFKPFTDSQLREIISRKDIDVIISQPLAGPNSVLEKNKNGDKLYLVQNMPSRTPISNIAHLHIDDKPTNYILITNLKAKRRLQGKKIGKCTVPVLLNEEKMATLLSELEKLHIIKTEEPELAIAD